MTEQRWVGVGATFEIPAGTYCQYAVSVNAAALQWVELFDPKGGLVFSAAGSAGGPPRQIAAGGFSALGEAGSTSAYRIIFGYGGGARRLAAVKTLVSELSTDGGEPIYRCLSFVAADKGDFSDNVDALAQIFYLPKVAPPPPAMRSHGVVAVIDAQAIMTRIASPSQDPLSPTPAPEDTVILLDSGDDDPLSDNSSGTLFISAGTGERLALVATTPSGDVGFAAVIYKVSATGGVLAPATAVLVQTEQPVPVVVDGQVDPTHYTMEDEPLFVWQSQATGAGKAEVTLCFYLTKIESGEIKVLGYFVWSGTVSVVGR